MESELGKQLEILRSYFNNYSTTLAVFLSNLFPGSSFRTYRNEVENLARKNSTKMIDAFILSALEFEEEIMSGDEEFFLGRRKGERERGTKTSFPKVLEFKSIWGKLTDENKGVVKSYVQILCSVARKYFDLSYQ